MSDDIRDRCDCEDCKSARKQLYFHSERNRLTREKLAEAYADLLNAPKVTTSNTTK